MSTAFPTLRSIVLDATDARVLAEFYRRLLNYRYRLGDEPGAARPDQPDAANWLVLLGPLPGQRLAIQRVPRLPRPTWPAEGVPQQLHLDLAVSDLGELRRQHDRALELGATLLLDRSDDPGEALFVYADPAGHPFCIFVATE